MTQDVTPQIGDSLAEFLVEATPDPKLRQLLMSMSEAIRTIAFKVRTRAWRRCLTCGYHVWCPCSPHSLQYVMSCCVHCSSCPSSMCHEQVHFKVQLEGMALL
jgi:flavoprotein